MKKISIDALKAKKLSDILKGFKSFKQFSNSKKEAYAYTAEIGVSVCPYCNINYTYTVVLDMNKKLIIRPEIDHFVPKSLKPSAQLDYKNLVPSCNTCNSRLKKDKNFRMKSHLHPFFLDFDSIKKFEIKILKTNFFDPKNFNILLLNRKSGKNNEIRKANRNIRAFKLIERYQHHKNEVISIFRKLKFIIDNCKNKTDL